MQKSAVASQPKSIKTAILFAVFVLVIVIISLSLRVATLVRESVYDGTHRFTVAIKSSNTSVTVVSVEKKTDTVSILHLTGNRTLWPLDAVLGIPVDGILFDTHPEPQIPSIFFKNILHATLKKNHLTSYDVFRLAMVLQTTPAGKIRTESYSLSSLSLPDPIKTQVADTVITDENKSIQIINATNISGVASRLDRVITTLGGNVIAVKTATATLPSTQITYTGDYSYTVSRLERLLGVTAVKKTDSNLSDILIRIGKDKLSLPLFQ